MHGVAKLLEAYAQDTEPPVPAVAENAWSCSPKFAVTFVLYAPIVTIVGDVDVVEHELPAQVQLAKL
jgi:hypothetical protein